MIHDCSLGEMMIGAIARTIEDSTLAFHGYGSPLVQLALHLRELRVGCAIFCCRLGIVHLELALLSA